MIKIYKDGNMWCALWGKDIQVGVAGFGKYIEEAIEEFSKSFVKEFYTLHKRFSPSKIVEMFDNLEDNYGTKFQESFKDWQKCQKEYYRIKQLKLSIENRFENMTGNPLPKIDKLVKQAKELKQPKPTK